MAICDRVRESDTESNVFHLKGVRQKITAAGFPFVSPRLWLFVVLSSPRPGEFPGYVRVINDRTDRVIYSSYIRPRPKFSADGEPGIGRARLRCIFPEEGQYTVQVWFFQKEGSDVLKGEMPFSIVAEGVQP